MAEAFLGVILRNLSSLIEKEVGLIMGVDNEMQKISSTLTTIQAVLEDAEDKQIESKPIRDWLCKLNILAYEVDDVLDECATHASRLNHAPNKLKKILYRHKIGRRMKQVTEKLDSVAAERAKFHLCEMPVDRPREIAASRETASLLNESDQIFGRDEDIEEIVKILVNDVREKQKTSVLPIIGMGGLGKTTLARLVFNDVRVKEHFNERIWVCVSDNFDIKTLVKEMIESVTRSGKTSDVRNMDALQWTLWELLSQKRYLVVLDDVWNEKQEKWFELRDILSCGSVGASIIVTTCQKKVADIMQTLPAHCLTGLSDEHCWMLLRRRAFGENENVLTNLEVIGKQIVKKCGGVPLAAKALGGILRFKRTKKEWMYVRESNTWSLQPEETLIIPSLRLSYHHLPLQLRQCFAYFAAFPKDHKISRDELILLWMSHGYISSNGELEVEEVGNEICDELVLRSLLQPFMNFYDLITVHDLVHDLAEFVMENIVPGIQNESNITASSTIRQVCLRKKTVVFPKSVHQDMDIFSVLELTSLRVLYARYTSIQDLPHSIVNLKHLRYLNLSNSKIRTLPNSLCNLWNLKILNLDYCNRLVALPKNMRYLHNLRHLCLIGCTLLSEMPSRIRMLNLLKTLSMFVVGHNKGGQLEELQHLNLCGRLEIRHLERVKDSMDAKRANLFDKKNLRTLELWWERNSSYKSGEDVDEKVLKALQPYPNLEYLTITGYNGRYLPFWMTNPNLEKIVKIEIKNCQNCGHLPKLGELPLLERLVLENVTVEYIIEDGVQNGNQVKIKFPSLKYLQLVGLPNLKGLSKEQESKDAFPNLIWLQFKNCSSLILPLLSSLHKVESLDIENMLACFSIETVLKFSNLRRLGIHGAKEISVEGTGEALQALKKLYDLRIMDCVTMTCLPKGLLQHLTALTKLDISGCPELVELPEEIKHLINLESLYLNGLRKMTCLPQSIQHISSLKDLYLRYVTFLRWVHSQTGYTSLHLSIP